VLGQPKTHAEYIQATSRVGRDDQRPGLVVTLLNIHKPRDRSHYERLRYYHETFYCSVEVSSVTPFSARALEVPIPARDGLKPDEFLVNARPSRLEQLGIKGREASNPANGNECAIIQGRSAPDGCHKAGLTTWDAAEFLVLSLSAELRKNASAFQTSLATEYMIESLRPSFPRLVDVALSRFGTEQIRLLL
jgi:hypothetical protein